jgi:CRISPR/Cas system-associated exonuclease Cas4 (RecB family)
VPWTGLQDLLGEVLPDTHIELSLARSSGEFLKDEYALMLTTLARAQSCLYLSAPEQHHGISTSAPARILSSLDPDRPREKAGPGSPYLRFVSAVAAAGPVAPASNHRISEMWGTPVDSRANIRLRLKRLSPSTISLWTICPTQLFYSRILHVEEQLTSSAAFGSLFHELMNLLTQHYRSPVDLRDVIRSVRLDKHINDTLENSEYFAGASEIELASARFHLRDMAVRLSAIDEKRLDEYYITQSEKHVGFEWQGWGFGGIADRVDRAPGGTYVVIDYKTGAVNKMGKTIREKSLPGQDKPEERLWQVPLYTRGARPGDARLPEMFCYYVVQPGGDDYPVGLVIGEESDMNKARTIFGGVEPKRFSWLTRGELNACLDEAADIARDVYAERTVFARTDNRDRCARCFYQRVCERTV